MAASDSEASERPVLEQRFSPWMAVRTTVHPQGLVIEVRRPFSERTAMIDYDRLVLEPSTFNGLRRGLLWFSVAWFAASVVCTLPSMRQDLPILIPPLLFILAVLTLLAAIVNTQRITMYLDREGVVNPVILRDEQDEPKAAAFVEEIHRAAVSWLCNPNPIEQPEGEVEGPRLADTLDRLLDLRSRALLSDVEFRSLREIALRR